MAGLSTLATDPKLLNSAFALLFLVPALACTGANAAREEPQAAKSAREDSLSRARHDSINRTMPGYVVDSILPMEEELRRFRAAAGGELVTELKHVAGSRDSLVARFIRSLEANDTSALRGMALDAREFAYLVYPESPYVRPPYRQPPGLVWMAIQNAGASGLNRLLERMGGRRIRFDAFTCDSTSERQGENTISSRCTVRVADPDGTMRRRQLFGPIIARRGRFKFVSYANEF